MTMTDRVRASRDCRSQLPVVMFDGDDTLWRTEVLYDTARAQAACAVADAGLDPVAWDDLQRHLDIGNVRSFGLSSGRFPASCVEAYVDLCDRAGVAPDSSVLERVRAIAKGVFTAAAPAMEDATTVLG